MDPVPGSTKIEKDGLPRVFDAYPEVATYLHVRGNEKEPDKTKAIKPDIPRFFEFDYQPRSVALPPESFQPSIQRFVIEDRLKALDRIIELKRSDWESAENALKKILAEKPKSKLIFYNQFKMDSLSEDFLFLGESFDRWDDSAWRIVNGNWKIVEGKLVQLDTGAESRIVESVNQHPSNFLAEVRLSVSGGQTWKSFGIRFDAEDMHEKTVYLSAYNDSKVQVSYSNNGKITYPANALSKIPVSLDQSYRLRVAVRGNLINVAVDGKHLVAFEFPVKRQVGHFQLLSFDSEASFEDVTISRLPDETKLYSSTGMPVLTLEEAKEAVLLEEMEWKQLVAKRKAIHSGHLADRSKAIGDTENVSDLVDRATTDQLAYLRLQKQSELARTRKQLAATLGKKRQPLEKKVAELEFDLKKLGENKAGQNSNYQSIRASLKALEGPDEKPESRNRPYPRISTGRRTAFARWIIDSRNPTTARVAINQIWMRHFGTPLVESVEDFGRRAKKPIQSGLLDWLAVDLMENGWRMKRIHRLIVTSRAYRMASRDKGVQIEHGNPFYQVRSSSRMESQVVRDSFAFFGWNTERSTRRSPDRPQFKQPSS